VNLIPSIRCLIGILLVSITTAHAQRRPQTAPTWKLLWQTESRFTSVGSARVFGDGSLLIADPGANQLFRVSKEGTSVDALGRVGSGPAEFRQAQSVQAAVNGVALLTDPRLQRFVVIDSTGQFGKVIPFPPSSSGLSGRVVSDRMGHVYFISLSGDPARRDVGLFRWNVNGGNLENLANLIGPQLMEIPLSAEAKAQRTVSRRFMIVPYAPMDGFTALANGELVVVRGETARVEWLNAKGSVIASRALPSPARVNVTTQEKERVRPLELRNAVPQKRLTVDVEFIVASDDGDLWLPIPAPRTAKVTEWIVMNRSREGSRTVRIPGNVRLIAVERQTVYVVAHNDDDLEQVQAFVLSNK